MAKTRLRGGRDYPQTVRMEHENVKLDPKDAIDAAAAGAVIRCIGSGDYENMNNIAVAAGTLQLIDPASKGPVKVGTETITVLSDPSNNNKRHRLTDPAMVSNYIGTGMVIVETRSVDIMSAG